MSALGRRQTRVPAKIAAADNFRGTYLTTTPEVPQHVAHQAALTVVSHVTNTTEAKDILVALGILDAMRGDE